MNFAKRLKQLSALTLLTSPGFQAAYAHPGHIADETVHSLLHIEHIIALVAAGIIAFTVYIIRNR
jgi:hydrogenase/urease accessory protein HupE